MAKVGSRGSRRGGRGAGARRPRRSLSTARSRGRRASGGDPAWAGRLEAALDVSDDDHEVAATLTHPLHSYPARLHPATAHAVIAALAPKDVLDPFCGSGTVLVEALAAGATATGVDANPLAVLLASAKTWTAPAAERARLRARGEAIAGEAIAQGKAARRAGTAAPPRRTAGGMPRKLRDRALRDWFAPHVRRELEHLAAAVEAAPEPLRGPLTACLSAVIYKVSFRASDTDPRRVQRRVGRGAAARHFADKVEQLCRGLDDLARAAPAPGAVHLGDARELPDTVGEVDLVLTSPPYLGTYDYRDHHDLRLAFLGLDTASIDEREIGARRHLRGSAQDRRRARRAWQRALAEALAQGAAHLRPGGHIAIVLGDSVADTRPSWADESLRKALPEGFEVRAWASQERPMLGRRERDAFGDRPKREYLFLLGRAG